MVWTTICGGIEREEQVQAMETNGAFPLEVEFLADGRVRIGATVLGAEDSQKFLAQTIDIDYPFAFQEHWFNTVLTLRTVAATGDRALRGPFILVPVPVPTGASVPDGDRTKQLIERYIESEPHGRRAEEARLRGYGYAVWALLGDLLPPGRTAEVVAREYQVPVEAVEAIWAYYLRNRAALDRRLAENRAA